MLTKLFRLVSLFGLLIAACTPSTPTAPADPYGTYKCVERTARHAPPAHLPPTPTQADQKEGKSPPPILEKPLCPDGQVPVAEPALPTVPKGNPLIGPIDAPTKDFFEASHEQGAIISKNLIPVEKFYIQGSGHNNLVAPVLDPPACNGVPSYGTCYYYASASYTRDADGGGMTMTVERPAYDGSGGPGHTLDEMSVQGGTDNGNIIELGWNVSTSQYSNANPHLFVFHWIGWSPTCYDACNWQQYSATYFPGMDLGTLVGRSVYIGYVYYEGNWWAWFDNQWLGYFPGSEWNGEYSRNSIIQWFGEVATLNGIPPHTDMGNGLFPSNSGAARNATLCDVSIADWVCWYRDQQSWGRTFPAYYDIDRTGFGETRYGGPGE